MKRICVVALFVGVFLAGSTPLAIAQGGQFIAIAEIHVKPGMTDEFEARRKRVIERWAENEVSFPAQMSVNEQGVYRQVSIVGDWEDFERRQQEFQAMSGNNPQSKEPSITSGSRYSAGDPT